LSAPVVLFTYNRPEHTKMTVEALSRNRGAANTELYIFCDGPKPGHVTAAVQLVQDYASRIGSTKCFRAVHVSISEENRGLANSIIAGVSRVLELHDEVIVLEDDLVTAAGFLEYMNEALDFFKVHRHIWSISGYALPIEIPRNYPHDVYVTPRACSWGWGTWKDRWEKVDWAVVDYPSFQVCRRRRMAFNRGGLDMSAMLDAKMRGKIDSWAIRWCYSQFLAGALTVYPTQSYVRNSGLDGSGTHSGVSTKYHAALVAGDYRTKLTLPPANRTILRRFRNYYLHPLAYAKSAIKQIALRLLRSVQL